MISRDYYGDTFKWGVGVVKDVNDPLNSNRVRVRIKGIHPEDPLGDAAESTALTAGTVSPSGTNNDNIFPAAGKEGLVEPDKSNLANASQLNQKISQHFTLAHLTTQVAGTQSAAGCAKYAASDLTQDIVYNLTRLATNVLDPIKTAFPNLIITSGWRPAQLHIGSAKNHPFGYAADIQLPGRRRTEIYQYVMANLKGKFNYMIEESTWIHIQLGGHQGTLENPAISHNAAGTY